MTLQFLGQRYEVIIPSIPAEHSELTGHYRGNPTTFSHPQAAPSASVTLTYRGIRYSR